MPEKDEKFLIGIINNACWWYVPPRDPAAYKKRGKFFASTYQQAEFYGRPNDAPESVNISNPLYGFSETEILRRLFPSTHEELSDAVAKDDHGWYKRRIALDARMYKQAKKMEYDAIVLLSNNARKCIAKNRKPYSIELNIIT